MKALILSAGQGRRLLPLTADTPKCVLPVAGRPLLVWQIETLLAAGVDDIVVVVGYRAERVEEAIAPYSRHVRTLFNPFHSVSDNLASCWMARTEMNEDFFLLNGDTLFEKAVVTRLLTSTQDITVTVDRKPKYDDDDMKVQLEGDRLLRIGKKLPPQQSDAEAIGLILFREAGGKLFRAALEASMRRGEALRQWYLSVVDGLADQIVVSVKSIEGMRWAEVDTASDLENASFVVKSTDLKSAVAE
ncbi:MAG: phosphocholine cytidylyltransferase family protein [Planctomycetota bacterium]